MMAVSNASFQHPRRVITTCLACFAAMLPSLAQAADEVAVQQLGKDTFMTGDRVRIDEELRGDAVLAGRSVEVAARVQGDGVIAGRELELRGPFGADLYAAGGQVRVEGNIAGNARLAGGEVSLSPEGQILGGVSIAAGHAEIAGSIEQYLQVAAGSTTLNGHVGGDVDVRGGELHLGPSARIDGALVFRGPQPASIEDGARVTGAIRHVASDPDGSRWGIMLFWIAACVGMALVGAVGWVLMPSFTRRTAGIALHRGGWALAAGLAVVIASPLIIALAFVSLVGIPFGLLAAWLYVMLFPLGYLAAVASFSDRLLQRLVPHAVSSLAHRMLGLISLLLVSSLIAFVPVIGPLTIIALTLLGIGALSVAAYEVRPKRGVGTTAPPAHDPSKLVPDERAPAST